MSVGAEGCRLWRKSVAADGRDGHQCRSEALLRVRARRIRRDTTAAQVAAVSITTPKVRC